MLITYHTHRHGMDIEGAASGACTLQLLTKLQLKLMTMRSVIDKSYKSRITSNNGRCEMVVRQTFLP